MFKTVLEQDFLSIIGAPIEYIGIYELEIFEDSRLECEGIIVAFKDKRYLIKSLAIGEDDFEFFYYEFNEDYKCRKIIPQLEEPIYFIRKENKEKCYPILRFQIGERPILVTADDNNSLTIGISHWDINDNWLEFENNNLLNDT